jgi:hypothetical protein
MLVVEVLNVLLVDFALAGEASQVQVLFTLLVGELNLAVGKDLVLQGSTTPMLVSLRTCGLRRSD